MVHSAYECPELSEGFEGCGPRASQHIEELHEPLNHSSWVMLKVQGLA